MALGGMVSLRDRMRYSQRPGPNNSPENAYDSAVSTQGANYDEIMGGYRDQLGRVNGAGGDIMSRYTRALNDSEAAPTDIAYSEAPEMRRAFAQLQALSENGGLNDADQANLRARGVSPIRAVYANMQRGMDRNRALGGGYSPNANASAARMARESSESIAGATQNVNAEIAKMVQTGKLTAAPAYANLASSKNELSNNMLVANAKNKTDWMGNRASLLNGASSASNNNSGNALEALRGMTSLYGTTPALVNTFGDQVSDRSQQNQAATRQRQTYSLGGLNAYARGR